MDVKEFYIKSNGDYDKAKALMMNDALIARLLTKFMDNNSYEQIISAYEKKNYRDVFSAAHAFKGVTGNLALNPLYEISSIITEATRHNDDVNLEEEIANLKKAYALIQTNYLDYIK